jgi:hypothetical protein
MIFYGLSSEQELNNHIHRACEIINNKNVSIASKFLLEIAAAETGLGSVRDRHFEQGKGVFQFDSVGFVDTKIRSQRFVKPLISEFNIDINRVAFSDLEYSPLVGAIWCRLKVYLMPAIPMTRAERAAMWKKYYNSELGSGTVEHYISMAEKFIGEEA